MDPYFSLRAETQFSDESNPLGSITLNPIKVKEAAGFARVIGEGEVTAVWSAGKRALAQWRT